MNSVLVFAGRSAIDSLEFRWQLLRVPEVSKVLKEAQQIVDAGLGQGRDLVSFVQSENSDYLAGGAWRELSAQLVQIGLYRRYQKNYLEPRFIIGDAGSLSAAPVCLGQKSIAELVMVFLEELTQKEQESQSKDFLVGQKLETAKAYENTQEGYAVLSEGKSTVALLEGIAKDHLVDQVITLGTASSLGDQENLLELGVVESVVMDPLLNWMLPFLKTA